MVTYTMSKHVLHIKTPHMCYMYGTFGHVIIMINQTYISLLICYIGGLYISTIQVECNTFPHKLTLIWMHHYYNQKLFYYFISRPKQGY